MTGPIRGRTERVGGLLLVVGALVCAGVALLVAVPRFMTTDDAKYVGIGTNLLAGAGATTVFGEFFPYHAPLWSLIVVAPHAWIGIDTSAWSHALNIISVLVIVSVAAHLGWRVRPLVGGIAAIAVVAFTYLLGLGRGMGLDLPASALTLLYLVLGLDAVERRSVRRAVLAGVLFSVAFLVKETALSFAPVPFLAALVTGHPWRHVAREAGATVLAALPGLAWWFALFALETNTVYRLGTPAWTLIPIGIGALLFGLWAIAIERFGAVSRVGAAGDRSLPPVVGWGLVGAWAVALLLFFAVSQYRIGQGFAEPGQLLSHIEQQFFEVAPVAGFGFGGIALLMLCRPVAAASEGVRTLVVALIAGLPLVLLVASISELPRHYVVQSVLLVVLGALGWVAWLESIMTPRRGAIVLGALGGALLGLVALEVDGRQALIATVGGASVWAAAVLIMGGRSRHQALLAVGLVTVFAASSLGFKTIRATRPIALDEAKAVAVARSADWIRANVPVGQTVAFESVLAYESAIAVQGTHKTVRIREAQDVRFDPSASLGLRENDQPPSEDWILLFEAPRRRDLLYGYRAGALENAFRSHGATVWILYEVNDASDTGRLPIADLLGVAPGIEKAAHWSTPAAGSAITTSVLRIDPAALDLDGSPLVISPAAFAAILDQLERLDPSVAQPIAARLLERGVVTAGPGSGAALEDRLRRLAGG